MKSVFQESNIFYDKVLFYRIVCMFVFLSNGVERKTKTKWFLSDFGNGFGWFDIGFVVGNDK